MRLTMIRVAGGDCPNGKTCPALAKTDRGSYVVVGKIVTDPEALAALPAGDGEIAVEVPASLLAGGEQDIA
jgi:hypothetical protein